MPSNLKLNTARSGVFISYARSDGEKFADNLRQRLEAEGVPLWQDRVGMEGGRDWWLQITEALDQVEFMTLVITPQALKSDTVRKEWRYARQQGVCVYPIKGAPDLDFESLPRWMRSAHFYDLDREWQKFVNDLNTRCQQKRVPFMVGDLPDSVVSRPAEFNQLLKFLVNEQREEPVAITAALRGAGGYGKTTLAKALCHDERVQDAFDDGILWVTLGENPGDLTGRVEDLIVTLGDERPGFTTLEAAVNRLKELLADCDILIVIDDVWDRAHLTPFIQGGPRCARLITTRNLDTLPAGTAKVRVDAMQQDEATAMLGVGLNPDEELRSDLTKLAARLGEWPLLLQLVNSALRSRIDNDKQSPRDAVVWINKALDKRGLAYFDARNSDERHHAVVRTIGVSLDLLNDKERERYGELAIFPEDVEIPVATLEKLWAKTGGFDEFDTEELCSRLNSFSLLWSYDANQRRIRLHDVVRKFLIDQQGDKLSSIHDQLLDAHSVASRWAEMPVDEPYLWDHLAPHLIEAGRGYELVNTVKDWRYLVVKTLIRKSLAVEIDLLMAEQIATDDLILRLLRRNFVNSGHLFNKCQNETDIHATLLSRLRHLEALKFLTTELEQHLKRPCLMPHSELPDLPHPALLRTLSGHEDGVNRCAISADGKTIVSASDDQTLKLWNYQSGSERFTLRGHAGAVKSCAISADGSTVVSASDDKTVKVWDARNGTELFTLVGHSGEVRSCELSADGMTIVSTSEDGTLKVWDARSGTERFTLPGPPGALGGCAVSADGKTIISGSSKGALKVWDGSSGKERLELRGHRLVVISCAISADGGTIVSTGGDDMVKLWDVRTGNERILSNDGGYGCRCAISADGSVVAMSHERMVSVWDARSGIESFILSGHTDWVTACALSADGRIIVSSLQDRTLKVWDGLSRAEQFTLNGYADWVSSCAVSEDGATIVSGSDDGTLKVWDGRSQTVRLTLSGHAGRVNGCAVSADGLIIVSASWDETVKVWDGISGAERFTFSGHEAWVGDCAVSADGGTIISASWDKTLKVWDGKSGTERLTLRGHLDAVSSCAITPNGKTIVSSSWDHTLKVWDARSGAERFTLQHADAVEDCAVSADGTTIVSASCDNTLKVWDGQSGSERLTLNGHVDNVNGCAISADGSTIVSASQDQTLKLWDARSGRLLATLPVDGVLEACGCSADGEVIAAAGFRGIYFLHPVR